MPVPKSIGKENLDREVKKLIPSCILAIDRRLQDHIEGETTVIPYSVIFGDHYTSINQVVRKTAIVELKNIYSAYKWTVAVIDDLSSNPSPHLSFS